MPKNIRKIWINAGEVSGDVHGAMLLKALQAQKPELEFMGMGGLNLREAGLKALFRVEDLSVMGITEVIGHLPRIFTMLKDIKKNMAELRPDAVIVIDAPDFHFRVIKAARSLGIPVYYYISPKVWAWRSGRANFIRDNVRKLISILPFEQEFYQKFGMQIDYVGNPLVDLVDYSSIQHIQPQPLHIGLLPGSRKSEIKLLLPELAIAAKHILQDFPQAKFSIVRATNIKEELILEHWDKSLAVEIVCPENRWAFMRTCQILLAASGTVTLESALAGVPTVVTYKVSQLSYRIGKLLLNVKYASLANLILNKEIFPEFLQNDARGELLAKAAKEYLTPNSTKFAETIQDLNIVRQMLGQKNAPERAAKVILNDLASII